MTPRERRQSRGSDNEANRSLGTEAESHLSASEGDRSGAASDASRERNTQLPASEEEALAASDTGERILERGLTRLPPG